MAPALRVTLVPEPGNSTDKIGERNFRLLPDDDLFKIGRSSSNIQKNFTAASDNGWMDSPVISREHATMWASNARSEMLYMSDMRSMHGTFVNNKRLTHSVPHPVRNGDVVTFGSQVVRDKYVAEYRPRSYQVHCEWEKPVRHSTTPSRTYSVPEITDESDELDDEHLGNENRSEISGAPASDNFEDQFPVEIVADDSPGRSSILPDLADLAPAYRGELEQSSGKVFAVPDSQTSSPSSSLFGEHDSANQSPEDAAEIVVMGAKPSAEDTTTSATARYHLASDAPGHIVEETGSQQNPLSVEDSDDEEPDEQQTEAVREATLLDCMDARTTGEDLPGRESVGYVEVMNSLNRPNDVAGQSDGEDGNQCDVNAVPETIFDLLPLDDDDSDDCASLFTDENQETAYDDGLSFEGDLDTQVCLSVDDSSAADSESEGESSQDGVAPKLDVMTEALNAVDSAANTGKPMSVDSVYPDSYGCSLLPTVQPREGDNHADEKGGVAPTALEAPARARDTLPSGHKEDNTNSVFTPPDGRRSLVHPETATRYGSSRDGTLKEPYSGLCLPHATRGQFGYSFAGRQIPSGSHGETQSRVQGVSESSRHLAEGASRVHAHDDRLFQRFPAVQSPDKGTFGGPFETRAHLGGIFRLPTDSQSPFLFGDSSRRQGLFDSIHQKEVREGPGYFKPRPQSHFSHLERPAPVDYNELLKAQSMDLAASVGRTSNVSYSPGLKRKADDEYPTATNAEATMTGSTHSCSLAQDETMHLPDAQPREPIYPVSQTSSSDGLPELAVLTSTDTRSDVPSARKKARTADTSRSKSDRTRGAAKVLGGAVVAGVGMFLALAAACPDPIM